jgi:hypothetical protein
VPNTPNGPDRDEYLFRLDTAIRRTYTSTWRDEDARKSSLFGLLTARALYTRPDEVLHEQRAQLTEALAGPLVDEPGDVPEPDREPNGAYADDRPEPEGRSTDVRLMRWVKANVPDTRIRQEGAEPVTMTGGELFDLLYSAAERAYWWGADDVRQPGRDR